MSNVIAFMKKLAFVFSILFLASCAASYSLIKPTQADADRVKAENPDVTLAQLTKGRELYQESCAKCHSLKEAFEHSPEKVVKVMPNMAKKAHVNDADAQLIQQYILTMHSVQSAKKN